MIATRIGGSVIVVKANGFKPHHWAAGSLATMEINDRNYIQLQTSVCGELGDTEKRERKRRRETEREREREREREKHNSIRVMHSEIFTRRAESR